MSSKVFDIIAKEEKRQNENIELIASENSTLVNCINTF